MRLSRVIQRQHVTWANKEEKLSFYTTALCAVITLTTINGNKVMNGSIFHYTI